jgi:uncharacterized membrane protein
MSLDYLLRGMIGCIFAASASMALGQASFQGLGHVAGSEYQYSSARGVSGDGLTVVGNSGSDGFRWTASTGMVTLDRPIGSVGASANGINFDGSIIVGFSHGAETEGLRWTPEGLQTLSTAPVTLYHVAAGRINDDGSVIVGYGHVAPTPVSSTARTFRWTEADGMTITDLEPLAFLEDLSGDGLTVVGSYPGFSAAFRWTADEGRVQLGSVPGASQTYALGVSYDGSVIVGHSNPAGGRGRGAWRWTADEGITYIGDLAGGIPSNSATAVNSDGSVVVGYTYTGNAWTGSEWVSTEAAWIWTHVSGVRRLTEVLSDHGVHVSGWRELRPSDISADGRTIVGTGINSEGQYEAWIAVIPEPASLSLLAFGGLTMLRRRRACGQ